MTRNDFNALMDAHWDIIRGINKSKGKDYAGDDDALSNFKRQATSLGLTPAQVWGVYAAKHFDAIMSYCRAGQVESEPIEGRLHDLIVYSFLLLGLVEEGKKPSKRVSDFVDRKIKPAEIEEVPRWDDYAAKDLGLISGR